LGCYPVYHHIDRSVVTSSFLVAEKLLEDRSESVQEIFEYVFHGAALGGDTVFANVKRLNGGCRWLFDPKGVSPDRMERVECESSGDGNLTTTDLLDRISGNILDYFSNLLSAVGDSFTLGLTGGYDSRLVLAALLRIGARPSLFVYGGPRSTDVRRSREIAKGEGLKLDVIDRRLWPEVDPSEYAAGLEKRFYLGDGPELIGVFDNGSEMDTRIRRARDARLFLNGGGGEIYRDSWILDDRPISAVDLAKSYYDCFDVSGCRPIFDKSGHFDRMGAKFLSLLPATGPVLKRTEVEELFPKVRVRYFGGYNNSINNQLSYALLPLSDVRFLTDSTLIPIAEKHCARFEAALIRRICDSLATYPTPFRRSLLGDKPNLFYRLSNLGARKAPQRLRSAVLRAAREPRERRPYYLRPRYLREVFGPGPLRMDEYFDMDGIKNSRILSRVLTLELLFRDRF
jgi:asparagine synthase (glutamine-hydrolysing)